MTFEQADDSRIELARTLVPTPNGGHRFARSIAQQNTLMQYRIPISDEKIQTFSKNAI